MWIRTRTLAKCSACIGTFLLLIFGIGMHIAVAQPEQSQVVVDPFDKQNISGQTRIALVWGQHFEPPMNLYNSAINLKDAMNEWTRIKTESGRNLMLSDRRLHDYSFVFISTDKTFELTETERQNVREYFENGGFMFVDTKGTIHSGSPLKKLLSDTIPNARFEPLLATDDIFHSYFDFKDGAPNGDAVNAYGENYYLEGVRYKGRLVAVYSNEGYVEKWALTSDNDAYLRMGVNMVVYALTH